MFCVEYRDIRSITCPRPNQSHYDCPVGECQLGQRMDYRETEYDFLLCYNKYVCSRNLDYVHSTKLGIVGRICIMEHERIMMDFDYVKNYSIVLS